MVYCVCLGNELYDGDVSLGTTIPGGHHTPASYKCPIHKCIISYKHNPMEE